MVGPERKPTTEDHEPSSQELTALRTFTMSTFTPYKSMNDVSQLNIGHTKTQDDQRYNALRNLDDHSESSTEVGDWDDGNSVRPRMTRRRIFLARLKRYRWLLDTTLLLIIIGLLVEKRWTHDHGRQYELTGDITGFAPECKKSRIRCIQPSDCTSSTANHHIQTKSDFCAGKRI